MISVIIPLYNKEASIATALRGVLAQTYQDFEIVVVDDGSTDDGAAIVETFDDSRIRLIRQANAGVSAARNRGIEEAKGEYVAFLDADDEWMPEFLEEIAALIADYPESRARATNYIFNSNGVKSPTILRKIPFSGEHGVLANYFEVASCSHPPMWTSAVCIDRALLQEVGGFPVGIKSGEDLLTWARVAVRTNWAYSMKPLAQYNFDQVFVKERPRRMHDTGDFVGEQIVILMNSHPKLRVELSLFVSHWYRMRTSVFMRVGHVRETWFYGLKSLKYNFFNYKVYAMMILVMIPYQIRRKFL